MTAVTRNTEYDVVAVGGGAAGGMAETTWLDATAQADLVRRGEVSPKELAEAAIARIEAVNPRLDAVIRTRFEAARLQADGDLPDGPFRGIPILYKDVACTVAGEPTAFGLGPLREMAWPATSYLAEQFRAAGFIPLGRTNMAELATSATTEPRSIPPARNPRDPGHSASGSSGGSAAAVAAGLVPVAHATDGAAPSASRRVSAGWSGPLIGEAWAGGAINGAVTRTVRDAVGVLDVISKRMPGEPYYAPPLPRPLAREAGADPGRLRIGVPDRPDAEGFVDDPQCRAAVAGAARLLESLGHHVEQSAPAAMFEPEFTGHFDTLVAADAEATFQAFERLLGHPIGDEEIEPRNAAYRRAGRARSVHDHPAIVGRGRAVRLRRRLPPAHRGMVQPQATSASPSADPDRRPLARDVARGRPARRRVEHAGRRPRRRRPPQRAARPPLRRERPRARFDHPLDHPAGLLRPARRHQGRDPRGDRRRLRARRLEPVPPRTRPTWHSGSSRNSSARPLSSGKGHGLAIPHTTGTLRRRAGPAAPSRPDRQSHRPGPADPVPPQSTLRTAPHHTSRPPYTGHADYSRLTTVPAGGWPGADVQFWANGQDCGESSALHALSCGGWCTTRLTAWVCRWRS